MKINNQVNPLLDFAASLENVLSFKHQGGVLTEQFRQSEPSSRPPVVITMRELEDIDPRLPIVAEVLMRNNPGTELDIEGAILPRLRFTDTILYWHRLNVIPTKDEGDIAYREIHTFFHVDLNCREPIVQLAITKCIVHPYLTKNNQIIDIVLNTKVVYCDPQLDWLDSEYPGWRERYTVASELGFEGGDLLQKTLLKPKPAVAIATTDLTFE